MHGSWNCRNNNCLLDFDIHYNEIVHCLMESAECHIPKIPLNAVKHYWSDALDDLKNDSIDACCLWKSLGPIYELKKNAKYRYKLAIRYVANQFEERFSDQMLDAYKNKDFNNYWQCWKKKTRNMTYSSWSIDGCTADTDTADKFADHFSTVCSQTGSQPGDSLSNNCPYDMQKWLFSVDDINMVICNSLKEVKPPVMTVLLQNTFFMPTRLLLLTCQLVQFSNSAWLCSR